MNEKSSEKNREEKEKSSYKVTRNNGEASIVVTINEITYNIPASIFDIADLRKVIVASNKPDPDSISE